MARALSTLAKRAIGREVVVYENDNLVEGLRYELRLYQARGSFTDLAKKMGGYPTATTISRLAYGETKNPSSRTVIWIFDALGFKIQAIKVGK